MVMGKIVNVAPRRRALNFRQVKQVQKIINKNKQLNRYELLTSVAPTTAKSLTGLDQIGLATTGGNEFNIRNSDQILVQSLRLQGSIIAPATPTAQTVRLLLIRSKKGPLAVADLPSTTGQTDYDRVQVLYERIINIGTLTSEPIAFGMFKSFRNKKIPHMKLRYDDTVGDDIPLENNLYFYAVTSTATNGASIYFRTMIKYFES